MRSRAATLRRALSERARYESHLRHVEPLLTQRPRIHLFAAVPVVGDAQTRRHPLALCVDPGQPGATGNTRASIERQTLRPAQVLEMPLDRALRETRAPWLAVVASGTRLAGRALERLAQAVTLAPGAQVFSCDDDIRDVAGRRAHPRLRPGPSPDHWLECDPDFACLVVAREPALAALRHGGGDPHGLFLALSGPAGAGHAHVPMVLCHTNGPHGLRGGGPEGRAVKDALSGWETSARVEPAGPRRWRIRRPLAREPAVEAVVCFRDRPGLLERCARSLLDRSTYERLSLRLVDNGSSDSEMAALLGRLGRDERVALDSDPRAFNFSALNNAAATRSEADILVFLNNDTEVVDPGWVEVLLEHALRPGVGAVAPLLTYPDGRVQHAGVALGLNGWAGHPLAGLAPDAPTPFGSAADGTRNWMAVTGACLMVERHKFEEVGGFDESFAVGGGDVDLGLRLTAAGYRSLCVPHTRVIHDESMSRDPLAIPAGDFEASRRSYGTFRTVGDPFYHPSLTLEDSSCRVRRRGEPGPPS